MRKKLDPLRVLATWTIRQVLTGPSAGKRAHCNTRRDPYNCEGRQADLHLCFIEAVRIDFEALGRPAVEVRAKLLAPVGR